MYDDTSKYREVYNNHGIKLYEPLGDYHMSRYVAAGAQNVYSSTGATKDFIIALATQVKQMCEDEQNKVQLRTDIGTLMNNLLYRTQYPVDEDCAIRMGAIYSLMEGEDPDVVSAAMTEQKVKLAHKYPDLYTFFLTAGIVYTPGWNDINKDSLTTEYFQTRRQALSNLTPYNP